MLHSKMCSKWRPTRAIHALHLCRKDWCTLPKTSVIPRTSSEAASILARSVSSPGTGVSYTRLLICPHKKKSRGVRSGERGGHATGSPLPIQRAGYVVAILNTFYNVTLKLPVNYMCSTYDTCALMSLC
jgi:hypothetical protein